MKNLSDRMVVNGVGPLPLEGQAWVTKNVVKTISPDLAVDFALNLPQVTLPLETMTTRMTTVRDRESTHRTATRIKKRVKRLKCGEERGAQGVGR